MRPSNLVLERLREQAHISGEPHTTLAERYLEEGLMMERHPGVRFADGEMGRRAVLADGAIGVWSVIEVLEGSDGSLEAAAEYFEVDPSQIEIAMRYYADAKSEVNTFRERVHASNAREQALWAAVHGDTARQLWSGKN